MMFKARDAKDTTSMKRCFSLWGERGSSLPDAAGVLFASVNCIQAEPIHVPLDQQAGHFEHRLEDTNGIDVQEVPSCFHLAMFFNALLELDFHFHFLQVDLYPNTFSLGNFQFLFFLSHHIEHIR